MPVELIKDYYGDEIAIYYEWMNFFLKWIMLPAAMGGLTSLINNFVYTEGQDESPFSAIFSIGMAFWATLFAVNWKRHQRGLRVMWDNIYQSELHIREIRPEFRGEPAIDQITGLIEPQYNNRKMRNLESFLICQPMFLVVFVFLVCCYNITGVILPNTKHDAFLITWLADLAVTDAIFDANSNMAYITTIGQVVCTMFLNSYFRELAVYCTQRENHKY